MRSIFVRSSNDIMNLESRLNDILKELSEAGVQDQQISIEYSLMKSGIRSFQCALIKY